MIERSKERDDELDRLRQLPSIEAQLVGWFDWIEKWGGANASTLLARRGGTELYVRISYWRAVNRSFALVNFASVVLPKRQRGKGWFAKLRRIAIATMPFDGIVYETVQNTRLAEALRKSGLIALPHEEFSSPSFIQLKSHQLHELYKHAEFDRMSLHDFERFNVGKALSIHPDE